MLVPPSINPNDSAFITPCVYFHCLPARSSMSLSHSQDDIRWTKMLWYEHQTVFRSGISNSLLIGNFRLTMTVCFLKTSPFKEFKIYSKHITVRLIFMWQRAQIPTNHKIFLQSCFCPFLFWAFYFRTVFFSFFFWFLIKLEVELLSYFLTLQCAITLCWHSSFNEH